MTTIMLISIITTSLFLSLIAGFLIISWHKKHQSFRQFDQLLADITDQQNTRSDTLKRRLIEKRQIDPANAQSMSLQLIAAEKLFLQQFINQQIQQQPLDDFYSQLCELLDSYLNITPELENTQQAAPTNSAPIQDSENPATSQDIKPVADSEPESNPKPDSEPEPDWGDVFD